jgi:hypothetical protein
MSTDLEAAQRELADETFQLAKVTVRKLRRLLESDEPLSGTTLTAVVKLLDRAEALANVQEVQEREQSRAKHDAMELPFPASSPDEWGGE